MQRGELLIDPASGIISRRYKNGRVDVGNGPPNSGGYLLICIDGVRYVVHRVIWEHVHGPVPDDLFIDHINGVKTDNRILNLRLVTRTGNAQNQRKAPKKSTHGVLGVTYVERLKKWRAQIVVNKKHIQLGCFESADLAHQAYVGAKRTLHPTCTI